MAIRQVGLTIMRLDPFQIHLPAQMLAVYVAHIGYEKGILLPRITGICIDALDTLLQVRFCQGSPIIFAMVVTGVVHLQ